MPRYNYNEYEPEMRRNRRSMNRGGNNYTSNHYEEYPYYPPIYTNDYMMEDYPMDYRNEYRNSYNTYRNESQNNYNRRNGGYRNEYQGNYRNMAGQGGMNHQKMGFGKSEEYMLSDKEMKMWVQDMETTDNNGNVVRRGEKFNEQQAMDMAKRMGIKFDKFSEKSYWTVLNMMYSDYYSVIGDNPDMYARLAKAWLCDSDVAMMGDEKLFAYYCYVVEGEEF